MKTLYILAIALCISISSFAQKAMTDGSAVVETFTGFAGSAAPANWTASGTVGWKGSNLTTNNAGGWYGNGNMGYLGSGSAPLASGTWALINNTGSTIIGFTFSFKAQVHRNGSSQPSVTVTYSTSASAANPGGTNLTAFSPALTYNDGTANIAAGATMSRTVSSISIPDGNYLFIRFVHSAGTNSDILTWDDVSVTPEFAPLPVSLISFNAKKLSEKINLVWSTATEINNSHFELERSVNGQEFSTIATVQGAGNSNQVLNYSVTDEQPAKGINYYRLKQTDFNGDYSYSKIIAQENSAAGFEIVKMGTSEEQVTLALYSDETGYVTMELIDMSGKCVYKKDISVEQGYSNHSIPTGNLTGIYLIKMFNSARNKIQTVKVKL